MPSIYPFKKTSRILLMYKYCVVIIVFLALTPLKLSANSKKLSAFNSNLITVNLAFVSKNCLNEANKDSIKTDKTKAKKFRMPSLNVLSDKDLKMNSTNQIVTYKIYHNGRIVKDIPKVVRKGLEEKYRYVYFDKEGKRHFLGVFTIFKTREYKGEKGKYVNLISLEEVPKYYKNGKYQYHFNIDSPRSFLNEQTLASFFGAMLEVNFLDISCNGFSHSDGSSKPSRSHINGNNGDFKYLRIDKALNCGRGTSLNLIKSPDSLDYVRQNKWNDALFKFGWKSMLGWTFRKRGKTKYLHHLSHRTTNHHHHLHVQDYEPNFKEIKE